jgi:hypothetical protein
MNNKKYENGYWGKITYWTGKLNQSLLMNDLKGVDSAHNKLNYFIGKQWEIDYPHAA